MIFQPYRDLEAGDIQSLKSQWRDQESNPGPLAPQAKSTTTTLPRLPPAHDNERQQDFNPRPLNHEYHGQNFKVKVTRSKIMVP